MQANNARTTMRDTVVMHLGRSVPRPRLLLPAAVSAGLGAVLALSFGRQGAGALAIAALAAFAALLWRNPERALYRRARRGAVVGLAFGLGWFGGGLWWLYISMAVYGGMPAVLAAGAVLLFCLYLSIYPALGAAIAAMLAPAASDRPWSVAQGLGAALALAGAWTLTELLRGTALTGFPWLALGYSQVGNPLAGYASILGTYGVGFATLCAAGLLALLTQVSVRAGAPVVVLLVLLVLGGQRVGLHQWTRPAGAPLQVALLQGNVAQGQKFRPEALAPTLDLYGTWLKSLRADLIVTPETAIPVLPMDIPDDFLHDLGTALRENHATALVGIPLTRGTDQYTNSVLGLGTPQPYRYDKAHLVPFGEFIPWGFHWFVHLMNMPLGDFARGGLHQASFTVRGTRVAPTICYEDLFGEQLAQRFRDPALAPNVIANLTNLAWFGHSIALSQHLQIARMRSLEFQLPSIRATNTGATAVIGADGRVDAELTPFTTGVLYARIQGRSGLTPYAQLASTLGYAPQVLLCLLALGAALAVLGQARRRAA